MKKLLLSIAALVLVNMGSWAQNGFGTGGWLRDNWPAEQKFTDSEKVMLTWAGSVKTMNSGNCSAESRHRWQQGPTGEHGGNRFHNVCSTLANG